MAQLLMSSNSVNLMLNTWRLIKLPIFQVLETDEVYFICEC